MFKVLHAKSWRAWSSSSELIPKGMKRREQVFEPPGHAIHKRSLGMTAKVIPFPVIPVPHISSARLEFAVKLRLKNWPNETYHQAELGVRKPLQWVESQSAAFQEA